MINIQIITLFPEYFDSFKKTSIIARALEHHQANIECVNFRDYTLDKHNNVDDTICGGGAGMLLVCQPIVDCLNDIKKPNSRVVLLTPQGQLFNQKKAIELSANEDVILICGHYEGFDERIRHYVDEEISIGDYVLTGGEAGALVIADALIRLNDGVIREASHEDDSFSNGLLEYPQYTRPIEYNGEKVPEILLSGHHALIAQWRLKESLRKTYLRRPDLLKKRILNKQEQQLLTEVIDEEKNK